MVVVDVNSLDWVNGAAAAATMTPAFRDNLGPAAAVTAMLERYWVKCLWHDEETTRRIDYLRTDPGYADATTAYHDSVEECLVLDGAMTRDGEGPAESGDYFWRPPGFVHSVQSAGGFSAILMMEGLSEEDASGKVSRIQRPLSEAGRNCLYPDDLAAAEGPRGFVRRARSLAMDWQPLTPGPLPGNLSAKVLSANRQTGACSVLVQLKPEQPLAAGHRCTFSRTLIVAAGTVEVDGGELAVGSLVEVKAGEPLPGLRAIIGATLLLKMGSQS